MTYSNNIVADAVRAYWKKYYPRTVMAFFYQKYEHDSEWEWCEELVECNASDDYETVIFQSDFCEGQTCVKDISIVPLEDIVDYYIKNLPSAQPFDKDTNVPCKDTISRQGAIDHFISIVAVTSIGGKYNEGFVDGLNFAIEHLKTMPSVKPTYTDSEIQKIQDMEQAEIEKAFDLGREDTKAEIVRCKDCIYRHQPSRLMAFGGKEWSDDDGYCYVGERRTDD